MNRPQLDRGKIARGIGLRIEAHYRARLIGSDNKHSRNQFVSRILGGTQFPFGSALFAITRHALDQCCADRLKKSDEWRRRRRSL
jgi:hypothetical protein